MISLSVITVVMLASPLELRSAVGKHSQVRQYPYNLGLDARIPTDGWTTILGLMIVAVSVIPAIVAGS